MKKQLAAAAVALAATLMAVPAAHAVVVHYTSALAPDAISATGTGLVSVDYDSIAHTLLIDATWSGLSGTTTASHIHCCTAVAGTGTVGVAVTPGTLPGFPTGVSSGSYTSPLLDLTAAATYTSGFVTTFAGGVLGNAEQALIAGLDSGKAYFNLHTTTFPGGEIRGFLAPIPEPQTYALMLAGLAALGMVARRRRLR